MSDGCKTLKKQCAGEAENPLEVFERGKWCYYKGTTLRPVVAVGETAQVSRDTAMIYPNLQSHPPKR